MEMKKQQDMMLNEGNLNKSILYGMEFCYFTVGVSYKLHDN